MSTIANKTKRTGAVLVAAALWLGFAGAPQISAQQTATVEISIKNHRFQPTVIVAPANQPIAIRVKNLDPTPMEFESISLRVEKVVPGNSEATVNIRALQPGSYKFFDDFHQDTGNGVLVVK
jgi:Cupredoxin-like domain